MWLTQVAHSRLISESRLDQSDQPLRWNSGFRLFFGTTVTLSLEIKNNLGKSSVKAEEKNPKSSKKQKILLTSTPLQSSSVTLLTKKEGTEIKMSI